jgi:hypothetical protein
MAAALEGWSQAPKPKGWDTVKQTLLSAPNPKGERTLLSASTPNAEGALLPLLEKLNLVFGSGRPPEELIALVTDPEADPNARLSAFTNLTRSAKPELLPIVRKLINDRILATAARSALAAYDDPDIPKALLSPWPVRSQEQQQASIATLITRPAYAHALLDAVANPEPSPPTASPPTKPAKSAASTTPTSPKNSPPPGASCATPPKPNRPSWPSGPSFSPPKSSPKPTPKKARPSSPPPAPPATNSTAKAARLAPNSPAATATNSPTCSKTSSTPAPSCPPTTA